MPRAALTPIPAAASAAAAPALASVPAAQWPRRYPDPAAVLGLLKPVTWFPPMWAFLCGAVSSGTALAEHWPLLLLGLVLAGPAVCAMSQAVNDWFDRHVDAVNEPDRAIPSGRVPGRWGLGIAIGWTALSMLVAVPLGRWGVGAAALGAALAWAYSAPPLRLKRNGWWGNTAVAACYEGLPWATAAAVLANGMPGPRVLLLAALYSAGAHGIMTLNDFKSVEGDRRFGIGSLPVRLGPERAGQVACAFMAVPQVVVAVLLAAWGAPWYGAAVALLLLAQLRLMMRLLRDPRALAPWYNATGVTLYALGMLASAFAVRGAGP